MKKLKKLVKNPGVFFRDFLNKKYPDKNIEQPFFEYEENLLIDHENLLNEIEERNCSFDSYPVDVVFTWVDNKDPAWAKKCQTHLESQKSNVSAISTDSARFENRDEIYYSLGSVLRYMPWVNHIYIVTDNQTPEWLDKENKKISIIDHKEIIDEKYLPTFNSHVIEANLHKIPGLSENFIYFNDDVFVARDLEKSHFYTGNNLASLFLSEKSITGMRNKGRDTPTLSASENSIRLLEKAYQRKVDTPLVHSYIPLKKSIFELCWKNFGKEIEDFLPNKFRGNNDLNMASFFIPWLMYIEGKSVVRPEVCYYFNVRSNQAKSLYHKLLHKKEIGYSPHSFCANDFKSDVGVRNYERDFLSFLQEYYGKF